MVALFIGPQFPEFRQLSCIVVRSSKNEPLIRVTHAQQARRPAIYRPNINFILRARILIMIHVIDMNSGRLG
jgi:hypothetical protein